LGCTDKSGSIIRGVVGNGKAGESDRRRTTAAKGVSTARQKGITAQRRAASTVVVEAQTSRLQANKDWSLLTKRWHPKLGSSV
jgi:hypothetical protein